MIAAVGALTIAPLASAEAASSKAKSFSVSAHADNRKMDLDSGSGSNRTTNIVGKVRGGKVKGKKVNIYATNVHAAVQKRQYVGSAKINSKGKFSRQFKPRVGGQYRVEVVKKASGGRKTTTKTFHINAFEWPLLSRFYDSAASTGAERADKEQTGAGRNSSARWSTSYAISSGGQAVFNLQGYQCWRFNLKLAVSQSSPAYQGTAVVSQGGKVIARETLQRGGGYWEPSRGLSETLNANLPLVVSVETATDEPVRMILGQPKASCTFPDDGPR
jgi:hypothetical protein